MKHGKKIIYFTFIMLLLFGFFNNIFEIKAEAAEEKIVTDMLGREVVIKENIERIVSTYHSATQFIFALDSSHLLVGVPLRTNRNPLFASLEPELGDLPRLGSGSQGINLEEIMSLDPDLVVLSPHGQNRELADRLEGMGIPALVIHPESLAEIKLTINFLAETLSREDQGEKLIDFYTKIENKLTKTAELAEENRPRVYFANSEFQDTIGQNLLQDEMIELAGGINTAAEAKPGFVRANQEQIINWDPEKIIVSQHFQNEISKLLSEPAYQMVTAFENEEIYRFPSELEPWDFPGPSAYLGTLWLSQKLFPEIYPDLDFTKIVNEYYKIHYGLEETGLEFE